MRVLILSPGHPALGGGGAERASYSLFEWCKRDPRISYVAYVASVPAAAVGHDAQSGCFRGRQDEIVIDTPGIDHFTFQSLDVDSLRSIIRDLIKYTRPDVVHLHHFYGWGIEAVEILSELNVRLIFTVHEFGPICANDGQMRKTNGELCFTASPAECSTCLPKFAAGKFFVRASVLRRIFDVCDAVIAPSHFLACRLNEWRAKENAIQIDNVPAPALVAEAVRLDARPSPASPDRRWVIGYFGQITPYKGVDVLLQACAALPPACLDRLNVRIHGTNRAYLGTAFDRRLSALRDEAGFVSWRGAYRNEDVLALMQACDFVIVPSVWWENSPVVIQEAKAADARLIVSDIGGLRENTDPDLDFRIPPDDPMQLADCLIRIAARSEPTMPLPPGTRREALRVSAQNAFAQHLMLYGLGQARISATMRTA